MNTAGNPSETDRKPREVLSLYPEHEDTLPALFHSRLGAAKDRTALVFESRYWTYGDLDAAVTCMTRGLARHNIGKGQLVAHVDCNSDMAIVLFLALARLGAVFVPLNPELSDSDIKHMLGHCGAVAIACGMDQQERLAGLLPELKPEPRILSLEETGLTETGTEKTLDKLRQWAGKEEKPPPATVKPDDPLVVIYTSGTTGLPKGVVHTHKNYVLTAEAFVGRMHLQPEDRLLTVFPIFHINALFYSLGGALAAGAAFITAGRFSASSFWQLAVDTAATQFNMLAALGRILSVRSRSEYNPDHGIKKVYGSPIPADIYQTFRDEFGIPVLVEGYGMSEIPAVCNNPFEGPHVIGSMGKPALHPDIDGIFTEMRIIDEDGNEMPGNATGELAVRTPVMFREYLNAPEQTRAAFQNGWFLTGDLVRRDKDGYYYFEARKKDIIRRRGENISGTELDAILAQHPDITEAAVIAVPSELGDDEILAVLVAKDDKPIPPQAIIDWCRDRLARIKIPRYLVFTDSLPHTATHRVAKHVLQKDEAMIANALDMNNPDT